MVNRQCRILCVDDYPDSAEMLALLLTQQDYEVRTATSLREALQLARRDSFDLYVLDHKLPDGTGIELCRELKDETPEVPCVFYSGNADEGQRQRAVEIGADGYVAKPDFERLIELVQGLLSQSQCASARS